MRVDPHFAREYGCELNFHGRVRQLKTVAEQYFIQHPDQALEGDLCKAVYTVCNFAPRRNERKLRSVGIN